MARPVTAACLRDCRTDDRQSVRPLRGGVGDQPLDQRQRGIGQATTSTLRASRNPALHPPSGPRRRRGPPIALRSLWQIGGRRHGPPRDRWRPIRFRRPVPECPSAASQASASARSFSAWPPWPFTQCHSIAVRRRRVEQLLPQLGILDRLPVGGPPAVAAPAVDPFGDAVADVDAVGVQQRPGTAASAPRARGSRRAAPSGCWWSAARRRTAPSRARPSGSTTPQPPGPGLPLHAPSVKISTSVSSAAHAASSPRGSLNTIRSSTPSTGSSVTSKRSARQSTTSRTSSLGRRGAGGDAERARRRPARRSRCRRRGRSAAPCVPSRSATSTSRSELELFGEPITSTASQRAGDRLDRRLAVRGGVADVLAARPLDRGEAAPAGWRRSRRCRRPTAWSGSGRRAAGSAGATASASAAVSIRVIRPSGTWPNVPITSGWPAWPTNRMWRPLLDQPLGLAVDLGDQRAGGVEIVEAARLGRWPAPPWARRGPRRPPARRRAPRPARRRTPRPWPSGCRRRTCCGRSRGGHRPARRSARAPARRCGSRGRRRRRSRAARRSAG